MKRTQSKRGRKRVVFVVIGLACLLGITVNQMRNKEITPVYSTISAPIEKVRTFFSTPIRWVQTKKESVDFLIATYRENNVLEKEIEEYEQLKRKVKSQAEEITRLEEEAALKQHLTDYETMTAAVIARFPKTWRNTLSVDKGSRDGVERNMAVLSQKGLIGRVREVTENTSEIELVTTENRSSNHFPVKISSRNGDSFGILNEYDEASKQLIATQITKEKDIKEGDLVRTSGLGGNSPKDLPVGTIVRVKPSRNGIDLEVYIKPYTQMEDLSFVTIIQRRIDD